MLSHYFKMALKYKGLYSMLTNPADPAISERAIHFKAARKNRLLEIAEDYTELIADLIKTQGHARICDIAKIMGISHVCVLKTIKRLIRDGYITKISDKHFELTPKGQQTASFSQRKHRILSTFLLKLGVPENIVAIDVEGIEHHISLSTLNAIVAHMQTCSLFSSDLIED
jgi:DtxR family transcriptional regulator, manganese transport regulator